MLNFEMSMISKRLAEARKREQTAKNERNKMLALLEHASHVALPAQAKKAHALHWKMNQ